MSRQDKIFNSFIEVRVYNPNQSHMNLSTEIQALVAKQKEYLKLCLETILKGNE